MNEFFEFVNNNQEAIIAIIGAIAAIISYFTGNKKAEMKGYKEGSSDGAHVAINALKDDGKVKKITPEKSIIKKNVIDDVEAIGTIIASETAKVNPEKGKKLKIATEKVINALNNINEFNDDSKRTGGVIKIGSLHGQPLYAEEIIEKVSKTKKIYDSLKNLF